MSIVKNKKAYFDYEVLETYTAGLVLTGPEVKSIRQGAVNIKGNYVIPFHGELFVDGVHISPYKKAHEEQVPDRRRKLLMTKKEIVSLEKALNEKGVTAVVLELFWKQALVKAKIGLVRGKKKYDKRASEKKKDMERSLRQRMKEI